MPLTRTPLPAETTETKPSLSWVTALNTAINNLKQFSADISLTSLKIAETSGSGDAGDRSLILQVTNTVQKVLKWKNSTGRMRLEDESGNLIPLEVADASANSQAATQAQLYDAMPIGAVLEWPHSTLPSSNWAWANGQALSRTTYAPLFAIWGTQHGSGDGTSTFNAWDRRHVAAIGVGTMGGTTSRGLITTAAYNGTNANTLGGLLGEDAHANTANENGPHTHNVGPYSALLGGSGTGYSFGTGSNQLATSSSGLGTPHNNVQPSVATNYIFRAK